MNSSTASAKPRVVVGMSGGVDSSVAAYLLKQQGYDVVGVTMKVWPQDCISREADKCCGPQAIADARAVAHAIGIPHYVVDEAVNFERAVIDYFTAEYRAGRTPNPCVMCNEKVKFGNLWAKAKAVGAEFIATGHYAIVEHWTLRKAGNEEEKWELAGPAFMPSCFPEGQCRAVLRRGVDPRKDQSYFLFSLRQEQLLRALFPLGAMEKTEIRRIAREIGLKTADKVDSQEICFVPGNDYKAFLRSHLGEREFHPGRIRDKWGNDLGPHEGIELFTIGQRKGLPGGSATPRYVIDIDPATASVIVGEAEDLIVEEFEIDNAIWHEPCSVRRPGALSAGLASSARSVETADATPEAADATPFEAVVKIRYGHPGVPATIEPLPGQRARVRLHTPTRAVTPGQAAVCYRGDVVLGGGWICRQAALVPA